MKNKLIKEIDIETVFDYACKSYLANFYAFRVMDFAAIKIQDILSFKMFFVILTSLSIGLPS